MLFGVIGKSSAIINVLLGIGGHPFISFSFILSDDYQYLNERKCGNAVCCWAIGYTIINATLLLKMKVI